MNDLNYNSLTLRVMETSRYVSFPRITGLRATRANVRSQPLQEAESLALLLASAVEREAAEINHPGFYNINPFNVHQNPQLFTQITDAIFRARSTEPSAEPDANPTPHQFAVNDTILFAEALDWAYWGPSEGYLGSIGTITELMALSGVDCARVYFTEPEPRSFYIPLFALRPAP